jgi:hypothetical protein
MMDNISARILAALQARQQKVRPHAVFIPREDYAQLKHELQRPGRARIGCDINGIPVVGGDFPPGYIGFN